MFAVTGVTGKVGGAVARALRDTGLPIRAVVRDAAKGAPWAVRGCNVAVADLDEVAPPRRSRASTAPSRCCRPFSIQRPVFRRPRR